MKKFLFISALSCLMCGCSEKIADEPKDTGNETDKNTPPITVVDFDNMLGFAYSQLPPEQQQDVKSINAFTFDLLKAINNEYDKSISCDLRGNFVVSPVSIAIDLAMASNFSDNDTRAQILKLLGIGSMETMNSICGFLMDKVPQKANGAYISISNSLWHDSSITPLTEPCDLIRDVYKSQIESADFADAATVTRINRWVSDATDNRIPEIVSPDMLAVNPAIWINAICLEGEWSNKFNRKYTTDETFHGTDGESQIKMMHQTMQAYIGIVDGYSFAFIPINGYNDLIVILPPEGTDITAATEAVAAMDHEYIYSKMARGLAILSLPKYSDKSSLNLAAVCQRLGIDISSVSMPGLGRDNILGSLNAIQKVNIAWDEDGASAGIATANGWVTSNGEVYVPETLELNLDRPFIYFLRNSQTGTYLLAGRVCNM